MILQSIILLCWLERSRLHLPASWRTVTVGNRTKEGMGLYNECCHYAAPRGNTTFFQYG